MGELKRILIVEDSPTIIEVMRIMLKEMNVKIQTAGSEFGMFQSIESFGKVVDLVIMDITLKSENGLDLIEKLRQNPLYANIPVIVVTDHAQKDFILRAKELNVLSYIKKPIEKEIFISRLVDAIGIEPLPALHRPVIVRANADAMKNPAAPKDDQELEDETDSATDEPPVSTDVEEVSSDDLVKNI